MPTGIIAAGLASTASGSLYSAVSQKLQGDSGTIIADVAASQCTNMKTALKVINQSATRQVLGTEDDDDPIPSTRRDVRLLTYDLEVLHEWVQEKAVERVVLFLQGSESLESRLFGELIEILK